MTQIHCNDELIEGWASRYGMRQVAVGQLNVYFKREIRGMNYDSLSISTDNDLCSGPSPKTDYFVNSETPGRVFYKVKDNELQIYSQSVFTPPQNSNFTVNIVQEEVSPVNFSVENAVKLGYTELLLPIDSLKNCTK